MLRTLLEAGAITTHLQPVVDLASHTTVGHEALARGPRGHELETPVALFEAARAEGLLAETDEACVRSAIDAAVQAGTSTVFVNVECETFDGAPAPLPEGLRGVVEITERDILDRPAELLVATERARDAGWGIAIDDIGAEWGSLALLPLLRPDVVKLDRGVLADTETRETARTVRAARAYVDRAGALLLAEGIEDHDHEQRARGFGTALGQGWRYGRPAPAADAATMTGTLPPFAGAQPDPAGTPFELLEASGLPRGVATKGQLLAVSLDLEYESHAVRDPAVLFGTFQTAEHFTARTRARYARLAEGSALVAVFATGITDAPVPGVRGAALAPDEPLASEWVVIAIGPHQANALVARDLGDDDVDDLDRRFEYALLTDRPLIESCGRALLRRVAARASADETVPLPPVAG